MKLLVSPHNDDEALFAAFTILREKPRVVIVFDSYVQQNRGLPVTAAQRRFESIAAMAVLGVKVDFLGFRDDDLDSMIPEAVAAAIAAYNAESIYVPAYELKGHPQHNMVSRAVPDNKIAQRYMTYTTAGKSVSPRSVPIEQGNWIGLKLKALACYRSQMDIDLRMGCWPHFLRSQEEFYQV